MDLLLEILMEAYLGIFEILIPDHKFEKWQETLLKIACVLVCLIILVCIGVGVAMLIEMVNRLAGIILLTVGCVLLAAQIVLSVIVLAHQIKEERREKMQTPDGLNYPSDDTQNL